MKKTVENLLEINLEINSLLNSPDEDFNEKFTELLKNKDILVKTLKNLTGTSKEEFTALKNTELMETWGKIQELENENLNLIKTRKELIGDELKKLKTHARAISSYKFKKEQEPRLFDDSC